MWKRSRSKSFFCKRPGKEQALEFVQTLMPVTCYDNEITKNDAVHIGGESFPTGHGIVDICLIFFTLLTMQCKWTLTKRFTLTAPKSKFPMLRQKTQKVASSGASASYTAITLTIGLLLIFKAVYPFSKKYCHFL